MAGIDTGQNKGKRAVDQAVNMVPFIDLLLVTISFLLVTAVWTSLARVESHAHVAEGRDETPRKPAPVLRVDVGDREVKLSWQTGAKLDDVATLAPDDHAALERAIARAAATHEGDRAILRVPNALPTSEVVRLLDAIQSARRPCDHGTCVAFTASLSAT